MKRVNIIMFSGNDIVIVAVFVVTHLCIVLKARDKVQPHAKRRSATMQPFLYYILAASADSRSCVFVIPST